MNGNTTNTGVSRISRSPHRAIQFPVWHGSILRNKLNGTGHEYKRNRSYDPLVGRFTQEDPIGLAGGLNLYGFGNGDPVNSSDPFGLRADTLDAAPALKQRLLNDPDAKKRTLAEELEAARERFYVEETNADMTLSQGVAMDHNAPASCPALFRVPGEYVSRIHPATRGAVFLHPTPARGSWSDVAFHELAHLTGVLDRGPVSRERGGGGCIYVHRYPQGDSRNPSIFNDFPVPR